jgi:hypothetical protein
VALIFRQRRLIGAILDEGPVKDAARLAELVDHSQTPGEGRPSLATSPVEAVKLQDTGTWHWPWMSFCGDQRCQRTPSSQPPDIDSDAESDPGAPLEPPCGEPFQLGRVEMPSWVTELEAAGGEE